MSGDPEPGPTTPEVVADPEPAPVAPAVVTASRIPELMTSVLQSVDEIAKNILARLQVVEPVKEPAPEPPKEEPEPPPEPPQEEPPSPPPPPPPPPPAFEVPHSRNQGFLGRSNEIGTLFAMWKPKKKGRLGLVGLGGVGKTELAVEFVYRVREISPETSIDWLGPDELVNGARLDEFLAVDHDVSSLLIVDASKQLAESPLMRRMEKLQDFKGTIIFIARSTQTARLLADPREILELHKLEETASINLLRQCLSPQSLGTAREDQLREVVQLLTCLPRAIIQVASFMNNTGMDLFQFLKLYQKDEKTQLRIFGRPETFLKLDEDDSVISRGIFDLKSFRNTSTYIDAVGVLLQLYFLGGASIPLSLFASIDELDFIIIMGVLKGHFLIFERDGTYNIHPLVYLAIKETIDSKRSAEDAHDVNRERVWRRKILHSFSRSYPGPQSEERDWWRGTLTHIVAGCDLKSDSAWSSVASIHLKESKYFLRKGLFSEALKSSSKAKACLPSPIPKDNLDVLEHHASVLKAMGKYAEAREVLKECPEELAPIAAVQKMAMQANLDLISPDKGFDTVTQDLRDIRESKRDSRFSAPDFWKSENEYATALMLKGDFREAETRCRGTLRAQTAKFGANHEDVLSTAHILAEIFLKGGWYENATEQIEEVFKSRESLLGPNHPDTLRSKVLKAEILLATSGNMADFEEAEMILGGCANGLSKAFSDTHPVVLSCKSSLAQALLAQGKYDASQKINLGVLATRENGPWENPRTHPDTLASKHQLAEILRLKEGCSKAEELSKLVLDERTERLTKGTMTGNDFHPDQLNSLQHRAIIMSVQGGQSDDALAKIKLALEGRKAILRPDHPDILLNLTWYGEILRSKLAKNHLPPAQRDIELNTIDGLHKQAIEGLASVFGPDHQNTLQCMTNLAFAKSERGIPPAYNAALALYDQVFRANLKNLGVLHPETLKSKTRLARALRMADPANAEEARKMWRDACDGFAKIFGPGGYGTVVAQKEYDEFFTKTHPTP